MPGLLLSGVLAQVIAAIAGVIRIPLGIDSLGIEKFGALISSLGCWALLAAVGESARANARQVSASSGLFSISACREFLAAIPQLLIAGLVVVVVFVFSGEALNRLEFMTILLVIVGAIIYCWLANYIGILEGRGEFTWFQMTVVFSQLASIALTFLVMSFHSAVLFAMAVVVPSLGPGMLAFAIYRVRRRKFSSQARMEERLFSNRQTSRSRFFTVIALAENVAFSMDTAVLLGILGAFQATNFNIAQKFMVAFSVVPTVLAPMIAVQNSKALNPNSVSRFQTLQVIAGGFVAAGILIAAPLLYDFVSAGRLAPDYVLLFFGCLNGLVGSFLSPIIQAKVQPQIIRGKALVSIIYGSFSVCLTMVFARWIGVSGAFAASTLALIAYAYVLKFRLKAD